MSRFILDILGITRMSNNYSQSEPPSAIVFHNSFVGATSSQEDSYEEHPMRYIHGEVVTPGGDTIFHIVK